MKRIMAVTSALMVGALALVCSGCSKKESAGGGYKS